MGAYPYPHCVPFFLREHLPLPAAALACSSPGPEDPLCLAAQRVFRGFRTPSGGFFQWENARARARGDPRNLLKNRPKLWVCGSSPELFEKPTKTMEFRIPPKNLLQNRPKLWTSGFSQGSFEKPVQAFSWRMEGGSECAEINEFLRNSLLFAGAHARP